MGKTAHMPGRPLERLSRMKQFTIDKRQVDPRGWAVVTASGETVGKAVDLVVDTGRMVASFIEVELDTRRFRLQNGPTILVPLSAARREGERSVVVPRLTTECIAELDEARSRHEAAFWTDWWTTRPATADDIRAVLADVKVGEEVRLPSGDEELIVARRAAADRQAPPYVPSPAPPPSHDPRAM